MEAIAKFSQIIRLQPDWEQAHLSCGVCYVLLERFPDAAACATEALRLNANEALAYFVRGISWTKTGDLQSGQGDIQRALTLLEKQQDQEQIQQANRVLSLLGFSAFTCLKGLQAGRKTGDRPIVDEKQYGELALKPGDG